MRAVVRKKIAEGLDERQHSFVTIFLSTGDEFLARDQSGYSKTLSPTVIMAGNAVARAIGLATRHEIGTSAPLALGVIKHLVRHGTTERVRLDAAKTLLDRAGHVAPKAREDTSAMDKPLHELSTEELRAYAAKLGDELQGIDSELGGRAKPVLDAIAAPLEPQAIDLIG